MSNLITVTVTLTHTLSGAARMVVRAEGRSKSVPMDYGSHDPFLTAMLDVCGRSTRIADRDANHARNRVTFDVYARDFRGIVPDYTLHTYADGFGTWHCRIDFPMGVGNTGEGERLISNARNAATRAIRRELLSRGMSPDYRLSYEVTANQAAGSGALNSLTISEA